MVVRVVMACLVLHNLLRMRYPTGQQDDFGAVGQSQIVLEGNDIPRGPKPSGGSQDTEEYSEALFHDRWEGPLANGPNLDFM